MSALICGSMAFDTIMVFPDRFKNHLLPEQLHILNVSFLVPEMRRNFGGCAGNIAYNLKLLGDEPLIMATVGTDFAPYRHHLTQLGLRTDYLREIAVLERRECWSFSFHGSLFLRWLPAHNLMLPLSSCNSILHWLCLRQPVEASGVGSFSAQ